MYFIDKFELLSIDNDIQNRKEVLLPAGMFDSIVSKSQTEGLLNILQKSGADATLKWQQSGHNLTQTDIFNAKDGYLRR